MAPSPRLDNTWRHEALQGVEKLAKNDHDRLRKDLNEETVERKLDVRDIEIKLEALKTEIKKDYVQKVEFAPLQRGFYGLITVILTGVIIAFMKIVGISK